MASIGGRGRARRVSASNTRLAILRLVWSTPAGLANADVAAALGLHISTTHPHLVRLAALGILAREPWGTGAAGRPPWRYRAATPGSGPGIYRSLATALLDQIGPGGEDRTVSRMGEAWGRGLTADATDAPVDAVVRVLRGLGFAPRLARSRQPDEHTDEVHLADDRGHQIDVHSGLWVELEESERRIHVRQRSLDRMEVSVLDGQRPRQQHQVVQATIGRRPWGRLDATPPEVDRLVVERQIARQRTDRDSLGGEVRLGCDPYPGRSDPRHGAVPFQQVPGPSLELAGEWSPGRELAARLVGDRVQCQQCIAQLDQSAPRGPPSTMCGDCGRPCPSAVVRGRVSGGQARWPRPARPVPPRGHWSSSRTSAASAVRAAVPPRTGNSRSGPAADQPARRRPAAIGSAHPTTWSARTTGGRRRWSVRLRPVQASAPTSRIRSGDCHRPTRCGSGPKYPPWRTVRR
jgi:predicted ArsR family transcriptional regulator